MPDWSSTGSVWANGSPKWISQGLRDPFRGSVARLELYRLRYGQRIPKMDLSGPERSILVVGCPNGALQAPFGPTDPQKWISQGLRDPFLDLVARLELYRLRLGPWIPKMDLSGPERSIWEVGCPIGALQAPFGPTDTQNGSLRV